MSCKWGICTNKRQLLTEREEREKERERVIVKWDIKSIMYPAVG